MSLVSVLVGLGIGALLILLASSFFGQSLDTAKKGGQRQSVEELKNIVRIGINCQLTMESIGEGKSCKKGTPIAMQRTKSTELISKSGTEFGSYKVQALCTDLPNEFTIRYQGVDSTTWEELIKVIACPEI